MRQALYVKPDFLPHTSFFNQTITGNSGPVQEFCVSGEIPGKELDKETGLYYFGARYLDPKTSRWISADPAMGEYIPMAPIDDDAKKYNQNLPGLGGIFNVVNMHVFAYTHNNPVNLTDPDGRLPGDPFDTADAAAIDVLDYINWVSIEKNVEYYGAIYQDLETGKYYATMPEEGTGDRSKPPVFPEGKKPAGEYHTHGAYSKIGSNNKPVKTNDPKNDAYNSDDFADLDKIGIAARAKIFSPERRKYNGYLGTPSGEYKKFNPVTGDVTTINARQLYRKKLTLQGLSTDPRER